MENWTEKYRPKTLKEIIGNKKAIEELISWAEEWNSKKPSEIKQKAVIIEGRPGVGKTSAALALANDFGWDVIELNASDIRNEEHIREIVTSKVNLQTIGPDGKLRKRRLIIFDEADNLYEVQSKAGDRGGKKAIAEAIEITIHPIILIVNDVYELFEGYYGNKLKVLCKHIKFNNIRDEEIVKALRIICEKEKLSVDPQVLNIIAARASGDLRAAINDLQSLVEKNKRISQKDLNALGYRDEWKNIYECVMIMLRTESLKVSVDVLRRTDEDPDYILLWLDENVPLEYTNEEDLANAYEFLSKADVYLGRANKRQQFSLLKYASDMFAAVSIAKKRKYEKHPSKYHFPTFLTHAKRSKTLRESRYSVAMKLGKYSHASTRAICDDLDYYSEIARKYEKTAILLREILDLDENELKILLKDNELIEKIMKYSERR